MEVKDFIIKQIQHITNTEDNTYIENDILDKIINLSTTCYIDTNHNYDICCDNMRQLIALKDRIQANKFENILYEKGYDELYLEDNKIHFGNNIDYFYLFEINNSVLKIQNISIKGYFSLLKEKIRKGNSSYA